MSSTEVREAPGDSRIEKLRWIADNRTARAIDGYLVDVQTATLLVRVHETTGTAEGRITFAKMPLDRLAQIAWKAVR